MYSADNVRTATPGPTRRIRFRSGKNSNWEGDFRVPAFVRWPGKFLVGMTLSGIVRNPFVD